MSEEVKDTYYTIAKEGSGKYTEKMSRFLSFAIPVCEAAEAKALVKKFQNDFHDARHVCWAYMLGPDMEEWQLNDNGEPSGTAGKPILGQIRSAGVTDLVVIVVRYFGGIKLGTSGLISAYREAARLAIEDAGTSEKKVMAETAVNFPYMSMNGVMKIVKNMQAEVREQNFDTSCYIRLAVPRSMIENLEKRLLEVDGVTKSAQ